MASSWINKFQHKPPPVLHQDALSTDGLKFQQVPRLAVQVRARKAFPNTWERPLPARDHLPWDSTAASHTWGR